MLMEVLRRLPPPRDVICCAAVSAAAGAVLSPVGTQCACRPASSSSRPARGWACRAACEAARDEHGGLQRGGMDGADGVAAAPPCRVPADLAPALSFLSSASRRHEDRRPP
ncbi:unnamed protein product [Urochloa humidicola]